jgi:hypothetical protein
MKLKVILSLVMAVVMISTFVLFVLGKIGALPFWIIILIAAIFSYGIMPRMK